MYMQSQIDFKAEFHGSAEMLTKNEHRATSEKGG